MKHQVHLSPPPLPAQGDWKELWDVPFPPPSFVVLMEAPAGSACWACGPHSSLPCRRVHYLVYLLTSRSAVTSRYLPHGRQGPGGDPGGPRWRSWMWPSRADVLARSLWGKISTFGSFNAPQSRAGPSRGQPEALSREQRLSAALAIHHVLSLSPRSSGSGISGASQASFLKFLGPRKRADNF